MDSDEVWPNWRNFRFGQTSCPELSLHELDFIFTSYGLYSSRLLCSKTANSSERFPMSEEDRFESLVVQIKACLSSVNRLNPCPTPGQGVTLILSSDLLPKGWVGIRHDDGRQAFGPAEWILSLVEIYAQTVRGTPELDNCH